MPTDSAQIDRWLNNESEHEKLEFKEAKEQFDLKKLCEYCVAIANEGGGHIVLGVSDVMPRRIVGTRAFADLVKTRERLFQSIQFRVDIEEVFHRDQRVVVFHVPSRLRGSAYHLDGRYLMRSGATLQPMSADRLRSIFNEGKPDWLEEYAKTGLNAQEVVELLDTQTFFQLLRTPYPTSRDGVIERLRREQMIDERDDGLCVPRLTAILLAKEFGEFPEVARKAARVIVYSGSTKVDTKTDRPARIGYAAGFQNLVRFVVDLLPQNELVRNAIRIETKLVPDEVIRELVANALIHQDFNLDGASVMIEIYSNRVEVSNPGEPLVPIDRFIDGYQSRNERLANIMRRLGICEEKGSGIDRVVTAAEEFQLPAPYFRADLGRTAVTIFGPKGFEQMDLEGRIRACYQHCVLRYVTHQRMTNQSLRQRFGLSEKQSASISQVISATIKEGLVKADEGTGTSRKYARYLPSWA